MNQSKTMFLMFVLIAVLAFVGRVLAGPGGLMFGLIIGFGMNFFAYWFSDGIVLRMYGAKEVTKQDAPELHATVERLCQRAGMPKPKVCVIEAPYANAFATGRDPNHAAVAVTTGILGILNKDELEGVLGHELSHVKNRDTLIATVAACLAGTIMHLVQMAMWFGPGRSDDDEGANPLVYIATLVFGFVASMLIQAAISRSREYLADEGGARLTGNPLKLASALKKLEDTARQVRFQGNSAAASLFIVNPLSGQRLAGLFSTHPATADRVARLEQLMMQPGRMS